MGHGNEIGRVEGDEFGPVRDQAPSTAIDGPALYSMDGSARLMGFIEGTEVRTRQGRIFLKFLAH